MAWAIASSRLLGTALPDAPTRACKDCRDD
jgi:hypothetical protein